MSIRHEFRKLLWKFGYEMFRSTPMTHPLLRRKLLMQSYNIDTVLDVGANTGQFSQELRNDLGYTKRIYSFEPLGSAFELLKKNSEGDINWDVFNIALGDKEDTQEINIAGNSCSSSLLDMLPSHLKLAPDSRYIGRETIEVKTVDAIFDDLCKSTNSVYMKIDTQGYESAVLRGAEKSLMQINTIQMEMSLLPLYGGELLFDEMCALMSEKGYSLVGIETGCCDPDSGQLFQIDGIFHRF